MKTLLIGLKTHGECKPPMNVGEPPVDIYINVAEISTIMPHKETSGFSFLEMKSGKIYLMPYSAEDLSDMLSSITIEEEFLDPAYPVIKFEYYGEGFDSDGEQRI